MRYSGLGVVARRLQKSHFTLPQSRGRLRTMAEEAELFCLINRAGTPMSDADMARAMAVAAEA